MSHKVHTERRARAVVTVASLALLAAWPHWSAAQTAPTSQPAAPASPATQPAAPDPARWESAIREFEAWDRKNSTPRDAVLFVGSSSIVGWPTARSFPNVAVINRGFGGAHLADVTHYAGRIVRPHGARLVVLYAGDNDIAAGLSPEQVRDDFRAFVQRVRGDGHRGPIVFLSIKPSRARWEHWPAMQRANALIAQTCAAGENLHFVDLGRVLLGPDSQPREELFVADRLHLSEAGYAAWTAELAPVLTRLLAQ